MAIVSTDGQPPASFGHQNHLELPAALAPLDPTALAAVVATALEHELGLSVMPAIGTTSRGAPSDATRVSPAGRRPGPFIVFSP